MPPQSNKNTSTPNRTFNQDMQSCLNGVNSTSGLNMSCSELTSKLNKDDQHNSSSFLRIQSPTNNYSNSIPSNMTGQHKNNAVPNFADAFESSFKQNNVISNSVPFDSMFPHASSVI